MSAGEEQLRVRSEFLRAWLERITTASLDTRTVDTHVRRLREKLGKAGCYVETVRGFGYRMPNIT